MMGVQEKTEVSKSCTDLTSQQTCIQDVDVWHERRPPIHDQVEFPILLFDKIYRDVLRLVVDNAF